jgi:hypothetical protein
LVLRISGKIDSEKEPRQPLRVGQMTLSNQILHCKGKWQETADEVSSAEKPCQILVRRKKGRKEKGKKASAQSFLLGPRRATAGAAKGCLLFSYFLSSF